MAKANINLLPQGEFESSTIGRILKWGMGTFRIIVIATEVVVMAAFLSRFWLDAQNSDLNDSIKVASAQISAQSNLEKQFRDVQSRLTIAKQTKPSTTLSSIIGIISSAVPPDITLTGLSVTDTIAQIKGVSSTEFGIAQFLTNLKVNKNFTIELQQVGSSQANSAQIGFSVKVSY